MEDRRRDIFLHALPSLLLLSLVLLNGCTSDYTIMTRETVVEVERVVEVPVYVEVEVPSEGDVQVDSFIQTNSVNGIDILWVIDNSVSMCQEQNSLAVNVNEFLDRFLDLDLVLNSIRCQLSTTSLDI